MDQLLIVAGLKMAAYFSGLIAAAAVGGAVVSGVVKVVTQIDDPALGFAGRLAGVVLLLYLGFSYAGGEILSFSQRTWGGIDYYRLK